MSVRRGSVVMALLFLYAAAVQYNDPDPIRWMAVYVLAAGIAGLSVARPLLPAIPLLLAIAALGWAGLLLPGVIETAAFTATEEERELAGLLLVSGWMFVLFAHQRRRGRQPHVGSAATD